MLTLTRPPSLLAVQSLYDGDKLWMCVRVNLFVSQTKKAQICCCYMNEPSSQTHPDSFPHSKSNQELELLRLPITPLYHWCNLSLADEETFNWVLTIWEQMIVSIQHHNMESLGPFPVLFPSPHTLLLSQPPVSLVPGDTDSVKAAVWFTFVFYPLLSIWGHIIQWVAAGPGWAELWWGLFTPKLWSNARSAAGQQILK